ncbi:transposase [Chryseobacterium sp. KBW03]|jgi:hypothetical protein|uniref:helix-turn-helix domain-containing protein n=1 Tax=Chryseobacterium sp. KBW03 TaxID=2153362 RepID=UPI000F5A057B|nr:helix-turn-helix domain-containing protein [Chryseobacterium sp. KBW03]RQO42555.1 transposase [Chryseobacterium sp. KBW03]
METKILKTEKNLPDYVKIYSDMMTLKYPEKIKDCSHFLSKKKLSSLEVIKLNEIIFGRQSTEKNMIKGKHRSYDKETIMSILNHQKEYSLNNSELSRHYKMSRNTIKKWKDLFNF